MAADVTIRLKERLEALGFKAIIDDVEAYAKSNQSSFTLFHGDRIKDDQLMYELRFEKDADNAIRLTQYQLTLQSIRIPEIIVAGVNTKELESRLEKADELYNQYLSGNEDASENHIIESANKDLERLMSAKGDGKQIAQLLMFKYWTESEYSKYIPDDYELKQRYQSTLIVTNNGDETLTADQAYKKISNYQKMNNEHPLSDEVLEIANMAIMKGEHWMAYNNSLYLIDKEDVHFFKNETDAKEFQENNVSDRDNYHILHFNSIVDIYKKVPYNEKVEMGLVTNPDGNGLYNYEGNSFTNALIDHIEQKQLSLFNSQLKTNIMNNENLQYLTDNIKYMGFGESLKTELEKNMNEGKAEFQLHHKAEINKKPFEATLNFRKSDSTDMYFFNNYHASLEKSNGEKMEQTFYLNKGKGITAKEAYNLLDGRAVHKDLVTKEGQPYKAWMQLDPGNKDKNNNFEVKQFHENYGFDLKAAVEKFPITDLKEPEKEKALMQSLKKGNVQSVTIEKDGNSNKMFIEADPQFKKVNLYDSNMKLVAKESLEQYKSGIDKGSKAVEKELEPDKKKELKQEVKPEKEKLEKKNDKTLLPKKRESTKKGLGVS